MRLLKNFIKASQIPEILRITLFQDWFRTCGGRLMLATRAMLAPPTEQFFQTRPCV